VIIEIPRSKDGLREGIEVVVSYYEALILILLKKHGALSKQVLLEKVGGLGVDPGHPKIRAALTKIRKQGTLKQGAFPMLKLAGYGSMLAGITHVYVREAMAQRRCPTLVYLAAVVRLGDRIAIDEDFGVSVGKTLAEAKELYDGTKERLGDKALASVLSFEDWVETGCNSGAGFWWDGKFFFIVMPRETQLDLLDACSSLQATLDELEKESA